MASEFIFLQGKVKYCRPHVLDQKFNKYSTVLYPNDVSLEKIRELQGQGVKNVLSKDEDNQYKVSISRPGSKKYIDQNGIAQVRGFAPVEVLDKDGITPLRNVNIGDGSDATLKVEVYSHPTPTGGKAKAMRWQSIRVDNLVPFDGKKDFTPDEEKLVRGMADQPKQEDLF